MNIAKSSPEIRKPDGYDDMLGNPYWIWSPVLDILPSLTEGDSRYQLNLSQPRQQDGR